MTSAEVAPTPAAEVPPLAAPDRWSRWSDRLNPILVREVQQALAGRAFVLTVCLALAVSVVIAVVVAGDYETSPNAGRDAFDAGLATLAPMLTFVVPMGAYQSMRLELRSGIVEQLFLSRLRPWSIVQGKLLAALVQFVLYVSVMAPLLATSYLLRGVDVPTIGVSLLWGLVACVAATAFAISAASQAVLPALQSLANIGVAFGLGLATFGLVVFVGSGEYARDVGWLLRSGYFAFVASLVVGGGLCSAILSGLVAQSFLVHTFENRSTGFRSFLFAMVPVALVWNVLFVPPAVGESVPGVISFLVMLGAAFGIFMTTEQQELSPRVRAHVPRSAGLAGLAAPFLPGRDRGMLGVVLYFALVGGAAWWLWPAPTAALPMVTEVVSRVSWLVVAFTLVYLTLAKGVRSALPKSLAGNHVARFCVPILLFAFCLAPVLVDVFTHGGVREWHLGHAMNPFWTIQYLGVSRDMRGFDAITLAAAVSAGIVLLQAPSFARGLREVLAAAAERRRRGSAGAERATA